MSCMHEESLVQVVCGWDAVQEKREEEDATKSSSIIIIVGVYVVDERLFEDLQCIPQTGDCKTEMFPNSSRTSCGEEFRRDALGNNAGRCRMYPPSWKGFSIPLS